MKNSSNKLVVPVGGEITKRLVKLGQGQISNSYNQTK